jgi:GLPGLI family protein
MKLHLITTLLLLSHSLSYAQNDSIPIGRVVYIQTANTEGDAPKNGYATLLFNNTQSLYIQNSAPKQDSIFSNGGGPVYSTMFGDNEGFPILKIHATRKLFCKITCPRFSKNHCIVTDTFGTIAWTLHPEHKRFGQYDCRRATGKYRGRDYEAWYTLDIPISTGPFKLGGLPGLILEARTLDGIVKFQFSSLEISSNIPGIIKMPSGKDMHMSLAAFNAEFDALMNAFLENAKSKGVEMTSTPIETIELNTEN